MLFSVQMAEGAMEEPFCIDPQVAEVDGTT